MKRAILIAIFLFSVFSCRKQGQTVPVQERELSVPEKELMDILSRDWKSLADTLEYFDSTMLSKGKFKGTAPDGVYYELCAALRENFGVEAVFKVQDSTWVTVSGQLKPTEVTVTALDTEINIKKEHCEMARLGVRRRGRLLQHPASEYLRPVFHEYGGDTVSIKLATVQQPMFEFWSSFADYSNSAGTVFSAPTNVKGNVDGAIGYWAGYGIDIREIVIE